MKKVLCTSLVLLMFLSGITVAFAATNKSTVAAAGTTTSPAIGTTGAAVTTTSPAIETSGAAVTTTSTAIGTSGAAVIVPDMTFAGTPVKLSLDAAYKKVLADSPGAEMAELNKQSAVGIANGFGERVHLISKAEDSPKDLDYSTTDKNILKIQKEYAAAQGPRNYEAELNKMKSDTLDNYYTLKELENQVQIAKDNLSLKETLLRNTQLKYKLGTVSKSDVLKAETSMYEAKDSLLAATDGLYQMKMAFNQFMGYDLMQNVTLTDTITEIPLSSKALAASIKDALANRNEIYTAAYNVKVSTLNLVNYKAYPMSSSKQINAKISLLMAETNYKNAPLTVESDVRNKFMAMNEKYSAVQTGKKAVENARETERLTRLQYDAGMATLSDVEGAQLSYYTEQLDYSKALLQYNLAVNDYELAYTVGTTASKIN
ncbi:MAG TPA: TolC family protein [Anaerovoracaceae bacterium]|nr:TolC family protein [Anaerovoracaceae bacterium]